MNTPNPNPHADPAWQSLGELNLPVDGNQNEVMGLWLKETLHLLDLPEDLLDRMLHSVIETAARALEALPEDGPGQITLCMSSTRDESPEGKAWGYFSITKTSHSDDHPGRDVPVIHWFLYREI